MDPFRSDLDSDVNSTKEDSIMEGFMDSIMDSMDSIMYADKENQQFESTRVSSANLLQEQMMSSQTQVSFQLKLIFFFSKIEEWKKI